MLNKIKLICAVTLILSMMGLSVISLVVDNSWRTFALGILYAIANVIIFII